MTKALPGEHLCAAHQGNHSHYAGHNCVICKLTAENAVLRADVEKERQYQWQAATESAAAKCDAVVAEYLMRGDYGQGYRTYIIRAAENLAKAIRGSLIPPPSNG